MRHAMRYGFPSRTILTQGKRPFVETSGKWKTRNSELKAPTFHPPRHCRRRHSSIAHTDGANVIYRRIFFPSSFHRSRLNQKQMNMMAAACFDTFAAPSVWRREEKQTKKSVKSDLDLFFLCFRSTNSSQFFLSVFCVCKCRPCESVSSDCVF